jgi:hypothetical protein
MKRLHPLLYFLCLLTTSLLQGQSLQEEYIHFAQKQQQEYADFRRKENEAFSKFLQKDWTGYHQENPVERPAKPSPKEPLLTQKHPGYKPVDIPKVVDRPVNNPSSAQEKDEWLKEPFILSGISEKEIAYAWESLSQTSYEPFIRHSLQMKKENHWCDWAYVLFIRQLADKLCRESDNNSKIIIQMFLLCQSEYKVRCGRSGDQLMLLIPTDCMLYNKMYLNIDNEKYFIFGYETYNCQPVYTFQKDFDLSNRKVSMYILPGQTMSAETLYSRVYSNRQITINANTNKSLIDLYKEYPQCDFSVYLKAPASQEVSLSVLPSLKKAIHGKTTKEAAGILLYFVQTAFKYQTDQQQFGFEKPFFIDECFYYPACDCEDRVVLYAFLIRTLLNLNVVLLDYPQHIATAVCFDENIPGDHLDIDGKRYMICDPSYINAGIGMAMPALKNTEAKIIR